MSTIIARTVAGRSANAGLAYTIDKWTRLKRFLIIGSEGNRFAIGEQELTIKNCANLLACLLEDGPRVVREIVAVSDAGNALKNDTAIFALAICAANGDNLQTRTAALDALPKVCRTGTHILMFTGFVNSMRGWGRGLKRAVANWFLAKELDPLAYQLAKYQQRNGWSMKDLLRLAHPHPGMSTARGQFTPVVHQQHLSNLLKWVMKGPQVGTIYPDIIVAMEEAKTADKGRVIELIANDGLTREMIPTQYLADKDVMSTLLHCGMPLTALLRNLANLTRLNVLDPTTDQGKTNIAFVVKQLGDQEYIHKSRLHPFAILIANRMYGHGKSEQKDKNGKVIKVTTWSPIKAVCDALENAFYLAFKNVEPTGLNYCIGLDISGSMSWNSASHPYIKSSEIGAALCLAVAKKETNYATCGFSSSIVRIGITANDTLEQAMAKARNLTFGSTNPGALIERAIQERLPVDVFVVITDNDVNSGRNVAGLLRRYREEMNRPNTKLIVFATEPSPISIADPNDGGMLDITGTSADVLTVMNEFARQ